MKRLVIIPALALCLVACETTTPPQAYGPATGPRAVGFSDLRVEQNRYRVTYRGSARLDRGRVEDLALLHAAEITRAEGYDWFRVVDRFSDAQVKNGPTVSLGTGGASFGRNTGIGLGLGTSFNLGDGGTRSVTLEVQLGKGPTPSERDVYDAADVQRSIGSRV